MSQNIDQVYISNPASFMIDTDLLYLGRSPYGSTDDYAITFADLNASIIAGPDNWVDELTTPVTMVSNTGYTADDGGTLVVLSLPSTSKVGDWLEVTGNGAGLWQIAQATGQQIYGSPFNTTSGASGYLASVNQYDNVRLRCIVANTIWTIVSQQSTGLTYN